MIVPLFELRCDDCRERFEDLHDGAIFTHAEVRLAANMRGWVRRKTHNGLHDYCPQCKGKH
jgi:hypothetical protein